MVKSSLRLVAPLALGLSLASGVIPSAALAKSSPCSPAFEAQIRAQYFDGGKVSNSKVDAYVARLNQKRTEVAALDASKVEMKADKKGKAASPKKIDKELNASKSLLALDAAIAALQTLKTASSAAQVCEIAETVTDLEGAIRIEGAQTPFTETMGLLKTVFTPWKIKKQQTASEEASNLYDPITKSYLSTEDIAARLAKGEDLSLLNPGPGSVFYVPQANIASNDIRAAGLGKTIPMFKSITPFPADNVFIYDGVHKTNTRPKIDTLAADGTKGKFKLKFTAEINAEPTVDAIMMTLGFPTNMSRYAKHIKMILPKGTSLSDLKLDWESYFSRDRVSPSSAIEDIIEKTETDSEGRTVVTFKEGSIESHPEEIARVGAWQYKDADHNARREVRGMTIVQNWLDNSDLKEFDNNKLLLRKNDDGSVQRLLIDSDTGHSLGGLELESPSLYQWKMVSNETPSSITLTFRNFHPISFNNLATLSDARWAARLIARMTRDQIATAIALGGWQECVQKAYVERMISRRNDLIRALGLIGSRQADGTTIQLLPVSTDHAKFDIENICDSKTLADGTNPVVDRYGYDVGSFFDPVLVALKRGAFGAAEGALGGDNRIVLNSKVFKFDPRFIGEVIVSKGRDFERNPDAKTPNDQFIVKEHLEIGLRLGASYGPYADTMVIKRWEMAYPTRSQQAESENDGYIRTLLLPKQVREHGFPDSYVLKTEHSIEVSVGVQADHIFSAVSPVIQAGIGHVNLWRSIYDHRDSKKVTIYRDRSKFKSAELELWLRALNIKTSIFKELIQWGEAIGKGVTLSAAEMAKPGLSDAVEAAIKDGDFSGLSSREKLFYTQDEFNDTVRQWSLLIWSQRLENRLDRIELDTDKTKNVVEVKSSKGSKISIPLSSKTSKNVTVEVFTSPQTPEDIEIQVSVMGTDLKTSDKEMQAKYLHFVNGLSVTGAPLIPLTTSLGYTTNGMWGNILTQSNTTYSVAAVSKILNMSDAQFWSAYNASATACGEGENGGVRDHAQDFLKHLAKAKAQPTLDKKMMKLAEGLRKSIFVLKTGFYSPSILGALNRIAGEETIYSRNLITVPDPLMVNLPEGAPLFGRIGLPESAKTKYLIFAPSTALDLYNMFDSWF